LHVIIFPPFVFIFWCARRRCTTWLM